MNLAELLAQQKPPEQIDLSPEDKDIDDITLLVRRRKAVR